MFLSALVGLAVLVANAGTTQARLLRETPFELESLYQAMVASEGDLQVVDVRPLRDPNDDDVGGYDYTHIPDSIPFPGCDPLQTPPEALAALRAHHPTIGVSRDGGLGTLGQCTATLGSFRYLEGGMAAWIDQGFPEADGEFVPPPPDDGSGGGCL